MNDWQEVEIGRIPSHWRVAALSDVLEIKGRIGWRGYKTSDLRESGPVVVGGVNIKSNLYLDFSVLTHLSREKFEESPDIMLKEGDVILVSRGNGIGDVGRYNGEFGEATINPSVVILTEYDGVTKYLYYYLSSPQGQYEILSHEGGSSIPALYQNELKKTLIPIPPLEEQQAISAVLSSLDDKIDLLHRQNKTLEALAQTLFRHWFIDGAEGDWEDGVIPDEFDFTMGLSPPGTSYNEEGIGTPMFQGNADFGFRFPENRVYTTDPRRFAEKFDTLISVRAPVGAQNMASEKCCIGRGVAAFRYKRNPSYSTYAYFKLRSLMDEIQQFNNEGTVFGSISKRDFLAFEITVPSSEAVERFQTAAKPIDDKVIENCKQIQTLENLRDALLPKLMSGEVRVRL